MTTTVKIKAHCGDTKEVSINIHDGEALAEKLVLQDGEVAERYVYDGREISVMEVEKTSTE